MNLTIHEDCMTICFFWECLWMIDVEAQAAHCRYANIINRLRTNMAQVVKTGRTFSCKSNGSRKSDTRAEQQQQEFPLKTNVSYWEYRNKTTDLIV